MTQTLVTKRGTGYLDREDTAATSTPSLYDSLQFFDNGDFIAARVAGNAFTVPAGLPIGWRCRFYAEDVAVGGVTIAVNGAYTVSRPPGLTMPVELLPGGFVELEVTAANRIAVLDFQGINNSGIVRGITPVATRTALSTIAPAARSDGMLAMVLSDGSLWRFSAASALAADYTGTVAIPAGAVTAANLVIVPAAGTGRWLRADKAFIAKIPFVQATANAAILWTPPAGVMVRFAGLPFWNITAFTAGDGARRIGASSSSADGEFTAAGDLLGGTAGQLPVLGVTAGVVGDAFLDSDAANTSLATVQKLLMPPATGVGNIRYDIQAAGTDTADGMICIPVAVEMTVAMIS